MAASFPALNFRLKCVSSLNGLVSTNENTENPPGTRVSNRAKNEGRVPSVGSVAVPLADLASSALPSPTPVTLLLESGLSVVSHPAVPRQLSSSSMNFLGKELKSTRRHWSCFS